MISIVNKVYTFVTQGKLKKEFGLANLQSLTVPLVLASFLSSVVNYRVATLESLVGHRPLRKAPMQETEELSYPEQRGTAAQSLCLRSIMYICITENNEGSRAESSDTLSEVPERCERHRLMYTMN